MEVREGEVLSIPELGIVGLNNGAESDCRRIPVGMEAGARFVG